jgi:hypothetical protein
MKLKTGWLIILIFLGAAAPQVLISQEQEQEQEIKDDKKIKKVPLLIMPEIIVNGNLLIAEETGSIGIGVGLLTDMPDILYATYNYGIIFNYLFSNNFQTRLFFHIGCMHFF